MKGGAVMGVVTFRTNLTYLAAWLIFVAIVLLLVR